MIRRGDLHSLLALNTIIGGNRALRSRLFSISKSALMTLRAVSRFQQGRLRRPCWNRSPNHACVLKLCPVECRCNIKQI
jgi:hypothetical protein